MNESINDKCVCRKAPATSGLVNIPIANVLASIRRQSYKLSAWRGKRQRQGNSAMEGVIANGNGIFKVQ